VPTVNSNTSGAAIWWLSNVGVAVIMPVSSDSVAHVTVLVNSIFVTGMQVVRGVLHRPFLAFSVQGTSFHPKLSPVDGKVAHPASELLGSSKPPAAKVFHPS